MSTPLKNSTEPCLPRDDDLPENNCELDCLCSLLPKTTNPGKDNDVDLYVDEIYQVLGKDILKSSLLDDIDLYLECDEDSLYVVPSKTPESASASQKQIEELSVKQVSFQLTFPLPKNALGSKSYPCHLCQFKTSKECLLRDHKFRVHDVKNLFPCFQCKYVGNMYKHLQKHISRKHGEPKTVKQLCQIKAENEVVIHKSRVQDFASQKGNAVDTKDPSHANDNVYDKSNILHRHCSPDVELRQNLTVEKNCTTDCVGPLVGLVDSAEHSNLNHPEGISEENSLASVCSEILTDNQHDSLCSEKDTCSSHNKTECKSQHRFCNLTKGYTGGKQTEGILHKCPKCIHQSKSSRALKAHMICKHSGQRPTYHCDQCPKVFKQWRSLQAHQAVHRGQMTYICELEDCRKLFASRDSMRYHTRTHKTHRPYVCECSKCFRSARNLRDHVKVVHAEKTYKCSHAGCSKAYSTPSRLRAHQVTHTGSHQCTWPGCGCSFRDHFNLTCHYYTHTGEKPLKCSHCDYSCIQRSSLKWHTARKHTNKN